MISVIVPIYNSENYLEAVINSVFAQTYSDWELILVDDGSTDSSPSICETAAMHSPKVRVTHLPNGGLSYARNAGLDMARGNFITFLDADDVLNPCALAIMMDTRHETNAGIICGGMRKFSSLEQLMQSTGMLSPSLFACKDYPVALFTAEEAVNEILYQKKIDNSAWGKLYDASLWSGIRFRENTGYEDIDIFYRIFLRANRIAAVDAPLYYYRQHSGSYLHRFTLRRADVLEVTQRLSDYMAANHPEFLPAAHSRQLSANFNILGLIAANPSSPQSERIALSCWKKIKELRAESLRNSSVRLKNKLGIIVSYLAGRRGVEILSRLVYRN